MKIKEKKLKWLAERGVESEAIMLSSELAPIVDELGNSVHFLPDWQKLLRLSGQLEEFARHLQFLKSLDKK